MNPSLFAKVAEIISEQLQVDIQQVRDGSEIVSGLGADSMDQAEIQMQIEEAFGRNWPNDTWKQWHTPADIVRFLEAEGVSA